MESEHKFKGERPNFKFPHLSSDKKFLNHLHHIVIDKHFPNYRRDLNAQLNKMGATGDPGPKVLKPKGYNEMFEQLKKSNPQDLKSFEAVCKSIGLPVLSDEELNQAAEKYESELRDEKDFIYDPLNPDKPILQSTLTENSEENPDIKDATGKKKICKGSIVRLSEIGKDQISDRDQSYLLEDDSNLRSIVTMLTNDGRVVIKPESRAYLIEERLIITPDWLIVENS